MKNSFLFIFFIFSLIFLISCGKSETECFEIQNEASNYLIAAIQTTEKAAKNSYCRSGNFARDMDMYIDKISTLIPELCDKNSRKRVKEELECLEGLKLALSTDNERLIDKFTTKLSQIYK